MLLTLFVVWSVSRFGWSKSYSSYAALWEEAVPMNSNMHLWSIITAVVAAMLVPAMIESGEGSALQCLGFFTPLYLIVVAFTPEYATVRKQKIIHYVGAISCAVLATAWIIFVRHLIWVPLSLLALAIFAAVTTKTMKKDYIFWGEMVMFASSYAALFL